MKFTLSWLKEFLETEATLVEITDALTRIGLEVEGVENHAEALAPFTVAKILEANPHPDAERLRVCSVETDEGIKQIVCGAPNARAGIHVVLAKPGAVIPANGMEIKLSKIRGVESQGMLCSERELGIGQGHEGIIELAGAPKVGTAFAPLMGLDDPVIEIAITPNRGDCLGIYGIARDLAAAGLGVARDSSLESRADIAVPSRITSHETRVTLKTELCSVFTARMIRGVTNGESPEWLKRKLKAVGLRPISTLVDITNYMTVAYGRPLHVYDADRLKGGLVVRLAEEGESFEALNDKAYTMQGGEVIIADASGMIGLGGIIGGVSTGCTEATVNVLLEAALFDPVAIANAGRAHGVLSDARYRFERGVDPEFIVKGSEIATRMILELCGGAAEALEIAGTIPQWKREIAFRPSRIQTLGGMVLDEARVREILERLGFGVDAAGIPSPLEGEGDERSEAGEGFALPPTLTLPLKGGGDGEVWFVAPPSHRPDIEGEADLVEEVLRIIGYDAIPFAPLPKPSGMATGVLTPLQKRSGAARRLLASRGFAETCTFSFMKEAEARLFGAGDAPLRVANPISAELSVMRPSLLPNLLDAARRNADRGFADLALFELGVQFFRQGTEAGQSLVAAGLRVGAAVPRGVYGGARVPDVFDVKADILALLAASGFDPEKAQLTADAPAWYHPGRSAVFRLGPKQMLAVGGELHPAVLSALGVDFPVAAFEVFLEQVPFTKAKGASRPPLLRHDLQAVARDFAFIVRREIAAAELLRAVKNADKKHIVAAELFDVYEGKGMEPGMKSLALSVRLQPQEKTFTDSEIETISAAIASAAAKHTGAILRSGQGGSKAA